MSKKYSTGALAAIGVGVTILIALKVSFFIFLIWLAVQVVKYFGWM